ARVQRLIADTASETKKTLIEDLLAPLRDEMNHAIANAEPLIHQRFNLASACFRLADHDVDVMLLKPPQALGELRSPEVEQLAVDTSSAITQPSRAGDHFLMETFAPAHDWAQYHHLFAEIGTTDAIEDLAGTEGPNCATALDTMLFSDFRIEQPQVVIDLRHRGNGRFLATLAEPLLDGDRRRYPGKQIKIRLSHDLKKRPRVRRKGGNVTPLSFRVDGVKGQGGFSRAAQAGDDHE